MRQLSLRCITLPGIQAIKQPTVVCLNHSGMFHMIQSTTMIKIEHYPLRREAQKGRYREGVKHNSEPKDHRLSIRAQRCACLPNIYTLSSLFSRETSNLAAIVIEIKQCTHRRCCCFGWLGNFRCIRLPGLRRSGFASNHSDQSH